MEKISIKESSAGFSMPLDIQDTVAAEPEKKGLPPVSLIDERLWAFYKNSDSDELIEAASIAERWAREIQSSLSEGEVLEDVWFDSFMFICTESAKNLDEAAIENSNYVTTGLTMQRAVMILSRCWQHGETLRELYTTYTKNQASQNGTFTLFDDY